MAAIAALLILLSSCGKNIKYHPNEVRLDEEDRNLNQKSINLLQSQPAKDSFRFVVIGDSQRFYDELEDFVATVNNYKDIAFVLLNGDITDFGLNKEYKWVSRKLKKLNMPFIAVIGNHDMLANGRTVYRQMFGPENFYFEYGRYRFICLNSNSKEKDPGEIIPDIPWLQQQIASSQPHQRIVVFSHVPPFNVDFDPVLTNAYAATLAQSGKVDYSIHGHEHGFSLSQYFGPPVNYLVVGAMDDKKFAIVNVNGETINVERILY